MKDLLSEEINKLCEQAGFGAYFVDPSKVGDEESPEGYHRLSNRQAPVCRYLQSVGHGHRCAADHIRRVRDPEVQGLHMCWMGQWNFKKRLEDGTDGAVLAGQLKIEEKAEESVDRMRAASREHGFTQQQTQELLEAFQGETHGYSLTAIEGFGKLVVDSIALVISRIVSEYDAMIYIMNQVLDAGNEQQLLQTLVETFSREQFFNGAASVYLKQGRELVLKASREVPEQFVNRDRYSLEDSRSRTVEVFRRGLSQMVTNLQDHQELKRLKLSAQPPDPSDRFFISSPGPWLAAPIPGAAGAGGASEPIGVIRICRQRSQPPFTAQDVSRLTSIVKLLPTALERIKRSMMMNELVQNSPNPMMIVDGEGTITFSNVAAEALLKQSNLLGQRVDEKVYLNEETARAVGRELWRSVRGASLFGTRGYIKNFITYFRGAEGKKIPVRMSAYLYHIPGHEEQEGSIGVFEPLESAPMDTHRLDEVAERLGRIESALANWGDGERRPLREAKLSGKEILARLDEFFSDPSNSSSYPVDELTNLLGIPKSQTKTVRDTIRQALLDRVEITRHPTDRRMGCYRLKSGNRRG